MSATTRDNGLYDGFWSEQQTLPPTLSISALYDQLWAALPSNKDFLVTGAGACTAVAIPDRPRLPQNDNIVSIQELVTLRKGYRRLLARLEEAAVEPSVWPEGKGAAHSPRDVEAVRQFASLLKVAHVPAPSVTVKFDGTIGLFWDSPEFYADVTVEADQITYLAEIDGEEVENQEPFARSAIPDQFATYVKTLARPKHRR